MDRNTFLIANDQPYSCFWIYWTWTLSSSERYRRWIKIYTFINLEINTRLRRLKNTYFSGMLKNIFLAVQEIQFKWNPSSTGKIKIQN